MNNGISILFYFDELCVRRRVSEQPRNAVCIHATKSHLSEVNFNEIVKYGLDNTLLFFLMNETVVQNMYEI